VFAAPAPSLRPVKRLLPALAVVLAACSSAAPAPTTAPPGPTTTTTIFRDTCDRLASDAADYLEVVVQVLDETPTDVFTDPARWPEALVALQQQGADLDTRAQAMECDPAAIQAAAFAAAKIDPKSALGVHLADLLGIDH
jgi:hypothetical protein